MGEAGLLGWDQAFRDLIDHDVVVGILADLIGPLARLDHAYGIVMAPGTRGLGMDAPSWPFDPSQYYLHAGGRIWNGLVAFSWALTPAEAGEGGFGCIPVSHRSEEPLPDLSLLYKYSPGNSTWVAHPAAPPDVLDLLTPRQRRLVEPPYVGGRERSF